MYVLNQTNPNNYAPVFARLAIALSIFPHGAQKLLGWYGGGGFEGTMGFLTAGAGLPWIIAFLVIIIEFFGPLFLLAGAFTRLAAFAVVINFIGVVLTHTIHNGYFMNWAGVEGQGEGLEYFILLFALLFILLIKGAGALSLDAKLWSRQLSRK